MRGRQYCIYSTCAKWWVVSYHRCVSVIWACCWVTLSVMEGVLTPPLPEGRLDTLHDSLYLHLSIIAFPLSSYAPASLPLSPSTFPPFSCHQCLCPPSRSLHLPSPPSISPSALHWAMAANRLQEWRQGLHQDQSCRAQMGLWVLSAGLLTGYSMEYRRRISISSSH